VLTEDVVTLARMSLLSEACKDYRRVSGSWPTSLYQIKVLLPPEKQEICLDAWDREFHLVSHSNTLGTIWLICYGPSGLPGGRGSNAGAFMELH